MAKILVCKWKIYFYIITFFAIITVFSLKITEIIVAMDFCKNGTAGHKKFGLDMFLL